MKPAWLALGLAGCFALVVISLRSGSIPPLAAVSSSQPPASMASPQPAEYVSPSQTDADAAPEALVIVHLDIPDQVQALDAVLKRLHSMSVQTQE